MSITLPHCDDDREKGVVVSLYRSLFANRASDFTAKELLDALAISGLNPKDDRLRSTSGRCP